MRITLSIWWIISLELKINTSILAMDGRSQGKFRYFMRNSDTPLTYAQAANKCAREGHLIAVIPSAKTNE